MKKLSNTREILEINDFICEFCSQKFKRESTMMKHACEPKRRNRDKNKPGNRIGYQCWVRFFNMNYPSTNLDKIQYSEFIKSAYYTAFVKFGHYCAEINVISAYSYADWLLKNEIRIDTWCNDKHYTQFLIEHLRNEDPLDAVARSIETMIDKAAEEGVATHDYLRYGNRNKICYVITTGRISPWVLYQSQSGISFLETLDETQQKMILDYINPEQWAIKFLKNKDILFQVKSLLQTAGY